MRLLNRIRLFATFRYTDPTLHPGRWAGPFVDGTGAMTRVRWQRQGSLGGSTVAGHNAHNGPCVPAQCIIGPEMAHVDTCRCGKRRYGVFGSWS